jgi:hypothetical protein
VDGNGVDLSQCVDEVEEAQGQKDVTNSKLQLEQKQLINSIRIP